MIGDTVLKLFAPFLEYIAPIMPGETFSKFFFEMEIGQQALLASIFSIHYIHPSVVAFCLDFLNKPLLWPFNRYIRILQPS